MSVASLVDSILGSLAPLVRLAVGLLLSVEVVLIGWKIFKLFTR